MVLRQPEPVFVNVEGAQESIPLAHVAWRAGTSNRFVVPARQARNRFLGSLKGLQIWTLNITDRALFSAFHTWRRKFLITYHTFPSTLHQIIVVAVHMGSFQLISVRMYGSL